MLLMSLSWELFSTCPDFWWSLMVCGRLAVSHPGMETLKFPHDHQASGESAGKQGNRSSVIPTKSIQSQNTKRFTSVSFNASLLVVHLAINTSSILSPDKSETLQMIMPHTWITWWRYPKIKSRFPNMGSHPTKCPRNNNTNETVLGICVFNRSCCSFLLLACVAVVGWVRENRHARFNKRLGFPRFGGPWCMVASSKVPMPGRVLVLKKNQQNKQQGKNTHKTMATTE